MSAKFRVGLLLCDHAVDALAATHGDYDHMITAAFAPQMPNIEWRMYDVIGGQLPGAGTDCDAWLLSGSRHGCGDGLPWMASLEDFIRALKAGTQPLVGLCFGHQIMARALGGEVARAANGWGLGIQHYELGPSPSLTPPAFMQPMLARFALPVCHQDQVTRLPADAELIARSDHCPHFMVRYAPHMLGVQGHPEFTPDFLAALIASRGDTLPAATVAAARATLDRAHDSVTLLTWLARFLGVPPLAAQGDGHD